MNDAIDYAFFFVFFLWVEAEKKKSYIFSRLSNPLFHSTFWRKDRQIHFINKERINNKWSTDANELSITPFSLLFFFRSHYSNGRRNKLTEQTARNHKFHQVICAQLSRSSSTILAESNHPADLKDGFLGHLSLEIYEGGEHYCVFSRCLRSCLRLHQSSYPCVRLLYHSSSSEVGTKSVRRCPLKQPPPKAGGGGVQARPPKIARAAFSGLKTSLNGEFTSIKFT